MNLLKTGRETREMQLSVCIIFYYTRVDITCFFFFAHANAKKEGQDTAPPSHPPSASL